MRRRVLLAMVAAMVCGLLAATPPAPVEAAGAADAQANELVRLINRERASAGLAALRVDTFLASKARDGKIVCPNDAAKVMYGRAQDLATYGWPADPHKLRLCPTYSVIDVMGQSWGYATSRAEILASNSYGTGRDIYGTTYTYSTTAHAMTGWMGSSGHRANILGGFDRVGCGAWFSTAFHYSCIFSLGGPNATAAPPTTPPFGNPPAPTPRPVTPAPPKPTVRPTVAARATAAVTVTPPTAAPTEAAAATATPVANPTDTERRATPAPTGTRASRPSAASARPTELVLASLGEPASADGDAVAFLVAVGAATLLAVAAWMLFALFRLRRRLRSRG